MSKFQKKVIGKSLVGIIDEYSKYSNEQIYDTIVELLKEKIKFEKSKQMANDILREYDIDIDTKFKDDKTLRELSIYAKMRKIVLPSWEEFYDIMPEMDDVIERIQERKMVDVKMINDRSQQYDSYCGRDDWDIDRSIDSHLFGSGIREMEIIDLYGRIT